jgi:hypothetical protein
VLPESRYKTFGNRLSELDASWVDEDHVFLKSIVEEALFLPLSASQCSMYNANISPYSCYQASGARFGGARWQRSSKVGRVVNNKELAHALAGKNTFCMLSSIGIDGRGRDRYVNGRFVLGRHYCSVRKIQKERWDECFEGVEISPNPSYLPNLVGSIL